MLRPALLGFTLACAVALSSSAVVLESDRPILWAHTTGQMTDLPIQDGVLNPDPWHFLQRMSLYRLMIAATDPFMGCMGTNATDSPIWALPLQLGWLLTSERLGDPTGATTCGLQTGDTMCISPQSWWSCMNHYASVLPFLSAAKQGFLGDGVQVQMQAPAGAEDYCTSHADCSTRYPDVMKKWDAFFQKTWGTKWMYGVRKTRAYVNQRGSKGLKASTDSPLPDNEKKDALLGLYWDALMASYLASAACNTKQSHYSSEEMSFASSWLSSAEYVSAAHFHSNLEKAAMFLNPMPGRVLKDGDVAPNIADLNAEENHTLRIFSWKKNINFVLGGTLESLWKSAMCSVTTREKGGELLEQLMLNPTFPTNTFMTIISSMSTSC